MNRGMYGRAFGAMTHILQELADRFEGEFHEDLAALNVLPPMCITRVSEYMDHILRFIEVFMLVNRFSWVLTRW